MLKIFLVEDEYVIREGIRSLNWASHGYEFCGEAPDGEMALPMILKCEPDIVITDIKMPFMNGLELAGQIKKELPDTEIVILSGYEEFGYAREAIELGVSKYLTKPISASKLIYELEDIREEAEQKKKERDNSLKYKSELEEDMLKARKDFFNDLVGGSIPVSEILVKSESLGLDLKASKYCILLVTTYPTGAIDNDDTWWNTLYTRLNEWSVANTDRFIVFNRDVDGQAILFTGDDDKSIEESIRSCIDEFIDIVSGFDDIRYYAGVGCIVGRISELNKSYEAAGAAFAHRFFDNSNRVVYCMEDRMLIYNDDASAGDVGLDLVDVKNLDRLRLAEFLKTGELSEKDYFLDEFMDKTGHNALRSSMFRQYVAMDFYFTTSDFVTDLGYDKDRIMPPDMSAGSTLDINSLKAYCSTVLNDALELRNSISRSKYKDVVDKVIGYIEEHYMDEELSLNTLAEYVRFSPNHLSSVFSQETGVTFSRYLIEYRIGKAKEALKCTSKKSSEIALEIGYRDPHYFSYMFKKITGMTPTQYRESK